LIDLQIEMSIEDSGKIRIQVMGSLNPHLRDVPDFPALVVDRHGYTILNWWLIHRINSIARAFATKTGGCFKIPQNFPKHLRFYGVQHQYMIDGRQDSDGEMKVL
jgi:hypothetical protein